MINVIRIKTSKSTKVDNVINAWIDRQLKKEKDNPIIVSKLNIVPERKI